MNSKVSSRFWKLYQRLPQHIQEDAKNLYLVWSCDPYHKSLQFKQVGEAGGLPVYSVRIGRSWRALGFMKNNTVTWFWIGSHEAYNKLLRKI